MLAIQVPAASAQAWSEAGGVRVRTTAVEPGKLSFTYWPAPNLTIQSLSARLGRVNLPVSPATPFPGDGQKAAVLILVDTSDPRRRSAVKKNIEQITAIAKAAGPHVVFGLGTFDTKYSELVPLGGDAAAVEAAVKKLRARGQTTELYRHTRDAIKRLAAFEASRKTLVLLSDGRAEDTAYTLEDVIKAAQEAGVSINGLGYSRTVEGTRAFQSLIRLAEETGGRFIPADRKYELPGNVSELIYNALNAGGNATIDLAPASARGIGGPQEIEIAFQGTRAVVNLPVTLPAATVDKRIFQAKNLPWLSGIGVGAVVGLLLLFVWFRKRAQRRRLAAEAAAEEEAAKAAMETPIAFLQFFDEGEPRFPMASAAIRIGRRADNDIQISNTSISAYHAEIQQRRDGTFIITDLDSLNGVTINDEHLDVGQLKDGDIVDLGETRFRFEFAKPDADGNMPRGTQKKDPATRPDWKLVRGEKVSGKAAADGADATDGLPPDETPPDPDPNGPVLDEGPPPADTPPEEGQEPNPENLRDPDPTFAGTEPIRDLGKKPNQGPPND